MADAEPMGATGEPPVGEQRAVAPSTCPLHRAGDRQHLTHAGTTLGPLVTDHHHRAGLDGAGEDGLHRPVLPVENPSRALEVVEIDAGHLDDAPLGGHRAGQDRDATIGVNRVVEQMDDRAVGPRRIERCKVLGDGPPGHRETISVQKAGIEQLAHDDRNTADAIDVTHVELAVRLRIGDVRHPNADLVEVIERQVHPGLVGDRQQVQHGVGGAPEGHHHRDRVLEGLLRHDLSGGDAPFDQTDHGLAARIREVVPAAVHRRGRGAAGQRHADRLGDRRHGVGREHAGAASLRGAGQPLDLAQFGVAHRPGRVGANGLEDTDDVERLITPAARQDGAAVDEDGRHVETCGCHEHAGQGLVTACEGDECVEALGVHDGLDRIGDDLTTHQGRPHALVAHGDAVGDRDGDELDGIGARLTDPLLRSFGESVQWHVARGDLVPRGADPDLGLAPVIVGHANRPQHGPGRGTLGTVGHLKAAGLDRDRCLRAFGHGPRLDTCGATLSLGPAHGATC